MSISRFQEKFLSPGCFTVVGVVIAGVFLLQGFSTCGQSSELTAMQQAANGQGVATVGGVPVLTSEVDEAAKVALNQAGAEPGVVETARALAGAFDAAIRGAATIALAEKAGVAMNDDALKAAAATDLDRQIDGFRTQATMMGQLKPTATPKEFDELLKKQTGRTLAEIKTDLEKSIAARLKDPAQKSLLMKQLVPSLYVEAIAAKNPPSDAELKASFDRLTVKRIIVSAPDPATRKANMDKALADLKNGTSFEEAMNRYSTEPAQPRKTVSENTLTVSGAQFEDPAFAPLRDLKAGATTTAPVESPEGLVLYKVVSRTNVPPADFAKNPAKVKGDFARLKAANAVKKEINAFVANPANVKWQDAGAEALALTGRADSETDVPKKNELLKQAIAKAKPALAKLESERFAALAYWRAVDALAKDPAQAAAVAAEQIPAIEAVLRNDDDFELRMKLVDLLVAAKKGPEASEALVAAASANNTFDSTGQQRFSDVAAKKISMKTAGLLDAGAEKEIDAQQTRWREDRKADEAARAAQAAEDAKAKAEADVAARVDAAKAAAEKAKAPAKK